MSYGTEMSAARIWSWHKKTMELSFHEDRGGGVAWGHVEGTQNDGTVYGLIFKPAAIKNFTCWAVPVPEDWDGTSIFKLRYFYCQNTAGDFKDGTFVWTLHHWVCQDWDNPIGSKSVTTHATRVIGDEGTTNYCMHCGTFQMDLTGGTFGTVDVGHTLFMTLQMPQGASGLGTALLYRAQVEYMSGFSGASGRSLDTEDKRET